MKIEKTEDVEKIKEMTAPNPNINKPMKNFSEREFFLVKEEDEELGCGYLRTFPGNFGSLGSIFVKKDKRGDGKGSYLINELEKKLKNRDILFVLIGVHKENHEGINFWQERGYKTLIDSVGKEVPEVSPIPEILEGISPVPLPDKEIVIMGKRLQKSKIEDDTFFLKEIYNATNIFEEFASKIPPIFNLYLNMYDEFVGRECKLAKIKENEKILHVGCGSVPYTLAVLPEYTEGPILGIDREKKAVKKAREVLKRIGLYEKVSVKEGTTETVDIDFYDTVFVSLQINPKHKVIKDLIEKSSKGTKIIFRNPRGILESLYEKFSEFEDLPVKTYRMWQPFSKNSILMIVKN